MRRATLLLCLLLVRYTNENHMESSVRPLLVAVPLSLTIQSANGFTRGFFSLFRRRPQTTPQPDLLEEFPSEPSGPVSYAVQQSQVLPYPFQFGFDAENNGFNQYFRFPGISNAFQATFPQPDAVKNPGTSQGTQGSFYPYRGGRLEDTPATRPEDAESFFALLAETDEHQCISRLVCEIGASPEDAGDFAQSVNEVFSTLQHFPPGSKVAHFNAILQFGTKHGLAACASRFQTCDEQSYDLVRNVQISDADDQSSE